jgi:hypothetical protein
MKKILIIAGIIVFAAAVTSCKKCTTCYYEYEYLGSMQKKEFPQECGTNKELKKHKESVEAEAQRHGVTSVCNEDK